MSHAQHISQVLAEVGPLWDEIQQIDVLDDATWVVVFDDETTVELHCDTIGHQLSFTMTVASLNTECRARHCELLLSYNFLKRDTGGFQMALDGEPGNVFLMLDVHHLDLDTHALAGLLATVLETGLNWRAVLNQSPHHDPPGDADTNESTGQLLSGAIQV